MLQDWRQVKIDSGHKDSVLHVQPSKRSRFDKISTFCYGNSIFKVLWQKVADPDNSETGNITFRTAGVLSPPLVNCIIKAQVP